MTSEINAMLIGPFCPCCGTGAHALELLAGILDKIDNETGNPSKEAQNDLIEWANNIRKQSTKKYIIIDSHDYMFDTGIPEMIIYNTKEEALIDMFGEDTDGEFESLEEYHKYNIENYTRGDGESNKILFEVDILTNKMTKMIIE